MSNTQPHRALYRKYRSQSFKELVGQPHVTTSLVNAISSGRVSHAYLFAGPRGTGKTSAARIFAYQINELEPQTTSHLDIIEIDAASNRRIDEIRDLREKVHSAPAAAKYKVYIIDEVHMLTTEAFNALLKTLEEPPAHVIFILATTEPHKLPDTIISRTQRFNFKPLDESVITKQLRAIATKEKIKPGDGALELIAMAADGSMRDAISLLDQLANMNDKQTLNADTVSTQLGMAAKKRLQAIVSAVFTGNASQLLEQVDDLVSQGVSLQQFNLQLVEYLRSSLRKKLVQPATSDLAADTGQISALLKTVAHSLGAKSWAALETVLVEHCLNNSGQNSLKTKPAEQPAITKPSGPVRTSQPKVTTAKPKPAKIISRGTGQLTVDQWDKVLSHIKSNHNSFYAVLKTADPKFTPGTVTLSFKFQFHKRRLEEAKNRDKLAQAIEKVCGFQPVIITALDTSPRKAAPTKEPETAAIDSVLEILGGEVVSD